MMAKTGPSPSPSTTVLVRMESIGDNSVHRVCDHRLTRPSYLTSRCLGKVEENYVDNHDEIKKKKKFGSFSHFDPLKNSRDP